MLGFVGDIEHAVIFSIVHFIMHALGVLLVVLGCVYVWNRRQSILFLMRFLKFNGLRKFIETLKKDDSDTNLESEFTKLLERIQNEYKSKNR